MMSEPLPSSTALPAAAGDADRWRRRLARIGLPLFLAVIGLRGLFHLLGSAPDDPWQVGDWLIHHADGFVRRGLAGEVVLGFSALTGLPPATSVGVVQMVCLIALLGGLYRLARPLPMRLPLVLLLASPALLGLYLHNPNGGFRKEVLLFALLAPLCARLAFDARPVETRERGLLAVALVLLSLCHEMLLAWMPLVVIALRLTPHRPTTTVWRDALILLPALLTTGVIVLFQRGDAADAAAICAALAEHAPRDCGAGDPRLGAVSFLAVDTRSAIAYMLARTPPPVAASYAAAALLAAVPFGVLLRMTTLGAFLREREPRALLALLAAILVQVAMLHLVATDHGRFIHITVVGLTLVLLQAMHAQGAALAIRPPRRAALAAVLALLFVAGWKLKHVGMGPTKLLWWWGALAGTG